MILIKEIILRLKISRQKKKLEKLRALRELELNKQDLDYEILILKDQIDRLQNGKTETGQKIKKFDMSIFYRCEKCQNLELKSKSNIHKCFDIE